MKKTTQSFFSQNLRGKYLPFIDHFHYLLSNGTPIICIQDLGLVGPDGPVELIEKLAPHTVIVNAHPTKKSRSTGIILHKEWELIGSAKSHDSGGLIGVQIRKGHQKIFVMSAYLPWGLDEIRHPGDLKGLDT